MPNTAYDDLKAKLEAALPTLQDAAIAQAQAALAELAKVGGEASRQGMLILTELSAVSMDVAAGNVSKEAAVLSIDNYLEGLKLIGMALVEKSKVESYKSALSLLGTLKDILLGILGTAAQVGLAQAGVIAAQLKLPLP
jgi:hypothetical protein